MSEYVITIKNKTESSTKSTAATKSNDGEKDKYAKTIKKVLKCAAVGYAVGVANTVFSHEVNMVALKSGQNELAQRISFGYDCVKRGVSMATTIGLGAAVGQLPGAIVATVAGLAMSGIELAQNQSKLNLERSAEAVSIRLSDMRAGAPLRR